MKQTFLEQLMGPGDPGTFLAAIVFALVGVIISLLYSSSKRDTAKDSATNFSWSYLLLDNIRRVVLSILLILVTLRFSREILGADLTMYLALLVGIGFDRLGAILRDKGVIDRNNNPPVNNKQ